MSINFRFRLREKREWRPAERWLRAEEAEGHPECRAEGARFRVSCVRVLCCVVRRFLHGHCVVRRFRTQEAEGHPDCRAESAGCGVSCVRIGFRTTLSGGFYMAMKPIVPMCSQRAEGHQCGELTALVIECFPPLPCILGVLPFPTSDRSVYHLQIDNLYLDCLQIDDLQIDHLHIYHTEVYIQGIYRYIIFRWITYRYIIYR